MKGRGISCIFVFVLGSLGCESGPSGSGVGGNGPGVGSGGNAGAGASGSGGGAPACAEGATRDCGTDVGACKVGVEECVNGAWGACKGSIAPKPEECNGVDDDCDGSTDEEFPTLGAPCDGPDADDCQDGVFVCTLGGTTVNCMDDFTSEVEICNGVDDDCDAMIDEGCGCVVGTTQICSTNIGVCKQGTQTCNGGNWGPCEGGVTPTVDQCNDLDDDCDGAVDEDFANKGLPCDGADADLCAEGVFVCVAGQTQTVCTDDAASKTEACNGIDDDCDGMTDENFPNKGAACDGPDADKCVDDAYACTADGTGVICVDDGVTRVELCNSVDDDCDLAIDEDFPEKLKPCDGADADQCKEGLSVCSADGTTTTCTDATAANVETCNNVDDDCDGQIDEDFPKKGIPCDGADSDACQDGVFACNMAGTGTECADDLAGKTETCNQIDDDCNGQIDEGLSGVWIHMTVDNTANVGQSASLVVDAPGAQHITYFDATNWDLKYATRPKGGTWTRAAIDSAGLVGQDSALGIDATGTLYVASYSSTFGGLKVGTRPAGGAWAFSSIATGATGDTAIAVDPMGSLHISYRWPDSSGTYLLYLNRPSPASLWTLQIVDSIGNPQPIGPTTTSIALDAAGRPHITYYDFVWHDLKHAYLQGGITWVPEIIDPVDGMGTSSDIAIDASDGLHVSYYDTTDGHLEYAYKPFGGAWTLSTIDAIANVGSHSSIAIDNQGGLHVIYTSGNNISLKYAYRPAGGSFTTSTALPGNGVLRPSLAVDAAGGAHVAYYEDVGQTLDYSYRCP